MNIPPIRSTRQHVGTGVDLGYGLLWLVFAMGSVVFIEPSPFDIAMLALAALFIGMGLRIPGSLAPLLTLCAAILIGGGIGLMETAYPSESGRHLAITGYLVVIAIVVAAIVYNDPPRALAAILGGHTVAAVIAATAGIAGYFSLFPGAFELFTDFARAKGTFKDPNVYGPFLVMAAIYALYRVLERPPLRAAGWALLLAYMSFAVLLSFSRAAWAYYALSLVLAILLLLVVSRTPERRMRIVAVSVGALILCVAALAVALSMASVADMFAIRGNVMQSYDTNRFTGQQNALAWILERPLGVGQYDFGAWWGAQPHNVYLYLFLQAGWLGGFAYLALVLVTLAAGVAAVFRGLPRPGLAIVVVVCFVGLVLEGLVVDTDHWRQFWVLLGAIWGLIAWRRDAGTGISSLR